jgi:hypothetical protein
LRKIEQNSIKLKNINKQKLDKIETGEIVNNNKLTQNLLNVNMSTS